MPSADEAVGQSQQNSTLTQGTEYISQRQKVEFRRYTRVVLEQDGFVFWVATEQYMSAEGSLHYATERHQDQDQTIGANQVTLTSEQQISEFNQIAPDSMWIGDWPIGDGPAMKIAFAARGNFYEQADIWHYVGFAVFPPLLSQLVENEADLPAGPIVSNSLPIWLLLNEFAGMTVPVFPSFLVPENIRPPYIAVHVQPESTEQLAAAPYFGPPPGVGIPGTDPAPFYSFAASTPARDTIELTLFGFSNQMAWQYLGMLIQASIDDENFGFANSPIPRDEKRTQAEIATIAQKKSLTIVANYTQSAADVAARRYIFEASTSIQITGGLPAFGTGALVQNSQTINGEGTVTE